MRRPKKASDPTSHARQEGKPTAAFARGLLRKAVQEKEALEAARKLARDYAAGRDDAAKLLADLEAPQFELLDADGD